MARVDSQSMSRAMPVCTALILCLSLLAYSVPGVASMLIFDRMAILDGEVWRLMSGHAVHFTAEHLIFDLLVFVFAGGLIEYRRYPNAGLLYVIMALAIGLSLLVLEPGMHYYGGLSGLACGAVVYLAWFGLYESPRLRLISAITLLAVFAKIMLEFYSGQSLLQGDPLQTFRVVPISHLLGALAATLVFILVPVTRRYSVT